MKTSWLDATVLLVWVLLIPVVIIGIAYGMLARVFYSGAHVGWNSMAGRRL